MDSPRQRSSTSAPKPCSIHPPTKMKIPEANFRLPPQIWFDLFLLENKKYAKDMNATNATRRDTGPPITTPISAKAVDSLPQDMPQEPVGAVQTRTMTARSKLPTSKTPATTTGMEKTENTIWPPEPLLELPLPFIDLDYSNIYQPDPRTLITPPVDLCAFVTEYRTLQGGNVTTFTPITFFHH